MCLVVVWCGVVCCMDEREKHGVEKGELLISKWFPITEVSVESVRERSASSALPPLYFLHVWFARRPLATSRAAVLGSLLPTGVKREQLSPQAIACPRWCTLVEYCADKARD